MGMNDVLSCEMRTTRCPKVRSLVGRFCVSGELIVKHNLLFALYRYSLSMF